MNTTGPAELRAHYRALFKQHGANAHAVQWSSTATQRNRFRVLSEILEPNETVIDVGAGLGDLLSFLREERGFVGRYTGLDLVPEFVTHARERYQSDKSAIFSVANVLEDDLPRADVYLSSGLFNNRMDDNWGYLTRILARMYERAERAVAFNALSTYVDYQDAHLYYCDPLALFDHIKRNLTRRVVLRHDYLVKADSMPFEFTMVLYR